MNLNKWLFDDFKKSNSKLLAVTKYWDRDEIFDFVSLLSEQYKEILVWLWENRVESLFEKDLDRESTHFIWNIQSRQIKHIVDLCSTIHSIDNKKHIKKIDDICAKKDIWVKVFLQINLDSSKESWISPEEIPEFLELIDTCENIWLVWFSAIWKSEFSLEEKREEFRLLKCLRSKYVPNWLISAGTSIDYKIALEEEIDIVRVGKSLVV